MATWGRASLDSWAGCILHRDAKLWDGATSFQRRGDLSAVGLFQKGTFASCMQTPSGLVVALSQEAAAEAQKA